ncbi:MAG TPA: MFS transporter [Ktedonobacterales bacterium]|jgi:EmrB/QacA subfamily drug resistance transporter|nr:MFS transporter [Ktedonobacterales bacterium]
MQIAQSTARQRWTALTLLAAVEFILLLDTAIVNIATPAIETGLHLSADYLPWIQNAYLLVFGGLLLLGGRAADLYGRKRFYLLGLGLFTASSLLAGLAPTGGALLAARALQGVGAAAVLPAEQSLLVTIFTDSTEFNKAFGIWGAIGAAGGLFGILLGGLLTQLVGWPWIFLINVPVGVAALLLSPRVMPESRAEGVHRLDLGGALTATAAIVLLAYAPIAGQQAGWLTWQALGALGLAIALGLAFLVIEARSSSPLVPLRFFRNRNANGANIVSFLVGAAHAPMFFLLSLYFQQALHYDALTAGLAMLPIAVLSLPAGGLLVPRALDHLGARRTLALGMALLGAGALLYSRAPIPNNFVFDILPGSILMALGLPATFVSVNVAALTAVGQADTGLASGLMNTAQRVGSGIGIAALLAVFVARVGVSPTGISATTLSAGFQLAFVGAAAFALLGAALALAIIRQPRRAPADATDDEAARARELAPAGRRAFSFHH